MKIQFSLAFVELCFNSAKPYCHGKWVQNSSHFLSAISMLGLSLEHPLRYLIEFSQLSCEVNTTFLSLTDEEMKAQRGFIPCSRLQI